MKYDIKAIPTEYADTQFRSRLEARWAAFFDIYGWRWEYEPIDLDGYIPDFVISSAHPDIGNRRLIEVKPALKFADYYEAQCTIDKSGWDGPASVVGAVVGPHPLDTCALLGVTRTDGHWPPWEALDYREAVSAWREAGNRVQWRSPRDTQPKPAHYGNKLTPDEVRKELRAIIEEMEDLING